MLALIKAGVVVEEVVEGGAFNHTTIVDLGDGSFEQDSMTSPAYAGWVHENWSLKTIQEPIIGPGLQIVSTSLTLVTGVPVRTAVTEPIPAVWPEITARQLRLALLSIDLHEADVDALLASDPAGMVEWKHASTYKRTHPLVNSLGLLFSITEAQIDDLWIWASEI